tara:strand:+ start:1759 stop:2034 length:276 start_codon:yes stop_codon:yes gene_type:complete
MFDQAKLLRQSVRRKRLWNEHVSVMKEVNIKPLSWEDFKRIYRNDTSDMILLERAIQLVSKKSYDQSVDFLRLRDEKLFQYKLPRKGKYSA